MLEKELRRLSRADLLEMLIDQSKELEETRSRLKRAEAALRKREIIIGSSGSIAEASLRLSGIFEAAEAACEQYIENIQKLNERHQAYYMQFERRDRHCISGIDESIEKTNQNESMDMQHRRSRRNMRQVSQRAIEKKGISIHE